MTDPTPKQLAARDALAAADAQMVQAKHAFSLAALACLRGDPCATARTRAALALVELARAALRRLTDQQIEESPK